MRRYQQLELLAPPPEPQPDLWLYSMWARYQDRSNALMYVEAESEEQAREIATKQLNKQGKPYRGITPPRAVCLVVRDLVGLDVMVRTIRGRSDATVAPVVRSRRCSSTFAASMARKAEPGFLTSPGQNGSTPNPAGFPADWEK